MSAPAAITAEVLATWRQWIGRREVRSQVLDLETMRRFAVAVGSSEDVERGLPPLAHWAYFLETVPTERLGADGHARLGRGMYPPISLPRRMFAASTIQFSEPLVPGQLAVLTLTLADLKHRAGKTGELVLLEVDRRLQQGGRTRVMERQTLIYRGLGDAVAAVPAIDPGVRPGEASWTPTPVDLFRFSAATFNSHRVHYDQTYTRESEGYPDLLVHGPLTAIKLFAFAQARLMHPIREFSFRASAPLFVNQRASFVAARDLGRVDCVRCDGAIAMSAFVNGASEGS